MPWGGTGRSTFVAPQQGAIRYLPDVMGVYRIHDAGMYFALSRLESLRTLVTFYERLGGIVAPEHEPRRRRRGTHARSSGRRFGCGSDPRHPARDGQWAGTSLR